VVLAHRVQHQKAEQVLAAIQEAGGHGETVSFDLRDREAIAATIAQVERSRRVDVLVNNAALGRSAFFALDDPAAWEEVIAVGLLGAAACTRAVVRGMMGRGRGAVVNVGSVSSLRSPAGQTAYAAAKAGLLGLTRSLAVELAPRGIRVNAVVPGLLDVGMAKRMPRAHAQDLVGGIPAGRVGRAEEVASAVLFLASEEASYIQGQALVVDGGLTL